MKTKLLVLIVWIVQLKYSYSQLKGSSYQFPEKFSSNYFFDPHMSYLQIKDLQVEGIPEGEMDYYKIRNTYNLQREFDNNAFYLEWYDLEKYLNRIVDSIIPVSIKEKEHFKVFIRRNPNYRIEVLGNGFIFINIGTLAVCKNETDLSYLIAHEIYHTYFNRGLKIREEYNKLMEGKRKEVTYATHKLDIIFNESARAELQADSFAYQCLQKSKQNLAKLDNILSTLQYVEGRTLFYYGESYHVRYSTISSPSFKSDTLYYRQNFLYQVRKKSKVYNSNYIIDSLYFSKLKKTTREECKKICFEKGDYKGLLKLSFTDYVLGDNSLKNLFNIFEPIRRLLYLAPELSKKGFLAEELLYKEFEYTNYSILKKPEYLFIDSLEFSIASRHPLLIAEEKPFYTYEEAYLYFITLAEEKGFNESTFSKALYHFSKKEEKAFKENLGKYLEKGGGLYTDFAKNLDQFGTPYIKQGKTNVIIDNSTNYTDNYYQSLYRIKHNNAIYKTFIQDTNRVTLTLYNELLGIRPKLLHEYQKLCRNIDQVYASSEKNKFYKKSYLGKELVEQEYLRNKYNENLLIYTPDWYKWFIENNFSGVLYQKISYGYESRRDTTESENFYTLRYINFFDNRPFIGKCERSKTLKWQTTTEMVSDARKYLFYKE
jgi:hypothetical protein